MIKKHGLSAVLLSLGLAGAALCASPGSARADGVMIGLTALPAPERARLAAEIAKAKAAHPDAFLAVAKARAALPELDANKRGRMAQITPMLKALGPGALHAMLEQLAVEGGGRGDLTGSAWLAWRVSLIEATGMLRDGRAAPVLAAILDSAETDFELVRAAAAALGRLGTDAAAAKLTAMAGARGPKQLAVLAGMGECRRLSAAKALAAAIGARPDPGAALHVVRSLGDVGSAWAWRTPIIAQSGEEVATRAEAARALVSAFAAYDGEVRRKAATAILVVDDPSTPALIQAARRGAAPDLAAALDALAQRFANSPLRKAP